MEEVISLTNEEGIILHVKDLNKKYKKFSLKNVNITLQKGEIMGFIGPNGAGKSTTINAILNTIPFDSGEIIVNGMNNKKNEIQVKQVLGFVNEQINLYSEATCYQMYKFIKNVYNKWDDSFFFKLINLFKIDLNKRIKELSKGTSVKFELVLALSHHPDLIILDEPTSGLDPVIRHEVLNLLGDIAVNENSSIFFSSHITEDIEKIATHVTYINDGEILLSDSKDNILSKYRYFEFDEEIPNSVKAELKFHRKNSAIVYDFDNFVSKNNFDMSKIKMKVPALDDILLFLIEEGNQ